MVACKLNALSAHVPSSEWNALPPFIFFSLVSLVCSSSRSPFNRMPSWTHTFLFLRIQTCPYGLAHFFYISNQCVAAMRRCVSARLLVSDFYYFFIKIYPTNDQPSQRHMSLPLLHFPHLFIKFDATTTLPIFIRFRFWCCILWVCMHEMYFRFIRFVPIWHWVCEQIYLSLHLARTWY